MGEIAFVGKSLDLDYLAKEVKITQFLNVKRPYLTLSSRRSCPEFPRLIAKVKGISLWDWQDVKRWAQDSERL